MRAVQLTAYGNPVEALKYVDIPAPEAPGPNQVERRWSHVKRSLLCSSRA